MGIDYIAKLRKGREVTIDAKCRKPGASKYWEEEPDLALEKWSVKPEPGREGKTGWTLDESKQCELILFTFDPSDCMEAFLMSFQLLRIAFRQNILKWYRRFKWDRQRSIDNGFQWQSECVFVPVSVVEQAITEVSHGKLWIAKGATIKQSLIVQDSFRS